MNPVFSIVTVAYNRGDTFLAETLESVSSQVESGFAHQHIIVNNASTDSTKQLLDDFAAHDERVIVIHSETNDGPATAMNKALPHVTGKYILPLDDDDMLLPLSLQMYRNRLEQIPQTDLLAGYALFIDDQQTLTDNQRNDTIDFPTDRKACIQKMIDNNFVTNSAVLVSADIVRQVGGWDDGVPGHDWRMWLKLIRAGAIYNTVDSYVSLYRVHPQRLTTLRAKENTYATERVKVAKLYAEYLNS